MAATPVARHGPAGTVQTVNTPPSQVAATNRKETPVIYGIDQYLAAGVPAAVFAEPVPFYRRGNGKLHLDATCGRTWQPLDAVHLPLTGVTDRQLCTRCAGTPGRYEPVAYWLRAASALADAYPSLDPDGPAGWVDVAAWRGHGAILAEHTETQWDAVAIETRRVCGILDQLEADTLPTLTVDRDAWCDAALLSATTGWHGIREFAAHDPQLDTALADLRLMLHRAGSSDGRWLRYELQMATAERRLNGRPWQQVRNAAVEQAIRRIREIGRDDVIDRVADIAGRYVQHWRSRMRRHARRYSRDVIVAGQMKPAAVSEASLELGPDGWIARLLAPVAMCDDLQARKLVFYTVPEPVAAALTVHAHGADLVTCGNAAGTDSPELFDVMGTLITEHRVNPADSLTAARGILAGQPQPVA